MVHIQVMDIDH